MTPVPERERDVGELESLLVKEMLPEALPAVVGANFTVKVVELLAFTLTGVVSPLIVKAADPLMLACEIVKVALPEFEIVTVCVLLLPVLMFPKATLAGFSEICGAGAAITFAVIGMLNDEFVALLVKLREPEAEPMLVGVKATVMPSCAPPAKVAGTVSPLMVKRELLVEAAEIVIEEVPGLDSVRL